MRSASEAFGRESPPIAQVTGSFVTAGMPFLSGAAEAPIVWEATALPFRFSLDPALVARYGEGALVDGMRQWDGIAGSRWSVASAGVSAVGRGPVADGVSHLFLKTDCPAGIGGYAYRQTAGASADDRYGQVALYLQEADIAVCSAVTAGRLRHVLAHEVGHVLGLDHLCDPGSECWKPGMGRGPHRCRLMYEGFAGCAAGVTAADEDAAVHLYPTLRRLAGPSRVETAARASYAAYAPGTASTIVMARADQGAHGPLAAAALAAVLGGPLLVGTPTAGTCLRGPARDELVRVAGRLARVVLVGDWPDRCTSELLALRLVPEQVAARDDVRLAVAVAERMKSAGRALPAALMVSRVPDAHGGLPDGVAAGAAGGVLGAPVLYSDSGALSGPVRDWLRRNRSIGTVYVMGGTATLSERVAEELLAAGVEVVRVAGPDRVATSLALAGRTEIFGTPAGLVLAAAGSWPDAVTASAVGGRTRAPVLLTPAAGDARVEDWLRSQHPVRGFVVGGRGVLPDTLKHRYARLVG